MSKKQPNKKSGQPGQPVKSNSSIRRKYEKKLVQFVGEMHDDFIQMLEGSSFQMSGTFPSPQNLEMQISTIAEKWLQNAETGGRELGRWLQENSLKATDTSLRASLKNSGFVAEFQMTQGMQTTLEAGISEQVGLIKSISSKYFSDVEQLVMQSVQSGRDLGTLSKELQTRYGLSKKRAALIARDQNNKSNAMLSRQRMRDLGIKKAIWDHSHAGKEPRPSHVKANGKEFDLEEGMYLDGKYTWPGWEINCRCSARPVFPFDVD